MAEKRKVRRITRRLPVTFTNGKEENMGTSSNVSATGIFIKTRKPFVRGTIVQIVLNLDDQLQIPLAGISIRSLKIRSMDLKSGMGVKLVSIPQEYKNFVNTLLQNV